MPKGEQKDRRRAETVKVTWRSILLGALLIPISVYWVTLVETKYYSLDGSCLPLFIEPVFFLFCVTALNLLAVRFAPKHAFRPHELLVVYIMNAMSVTFSGHDMFQNMFGAIVHPYWYATPENDWGDLFFRFIPSWLTVSDLKVLRGFYEGESTLYDPANLLPWLRPLAFWGGFVLVLMFMMLCMNTLIRRRWTEQEKLAYPNIQLPMRLTEQGGVPLFKERLFWIGFAVASFITVLNGIHFLYPQIPEIPYVKQTNVGQYFTERPWNALSGLRVATYPFMVGLAFFLPLDLSFSCWFFYLFRWMQQVFGVAVGFRSLPEFPYFGQQGWGAWLTLAAIAVWSSRRQLAFAFRGAFHPSREETRTGEWRDANEPISYRGAVVGLVAGTLAILVFSVAAGMALWVALLFFTLYFALSVAINRIRAEAGTPHEIYFVNPHDMMTSFLGTSPYSGRSLTILSMFYWFNRGYRNHPMPNQIEAFKMAEIRGIGNRRLMGALLVAIVVSIFSTFWANLDITYRNGVATLGGFKSWVGWESFNRLQRWLLAPIPPDLPRIVFAGIGSILVLLMTAARLRFLFCPFHPAGYALAVSFAMDYFWFAVLVAWALKWLILRQGGIRAHQRALPFFLGLMLGDYFFGSIWAIIGPLAGIRTYKIFI